MAIHDLRAKVNPARFPGANATRRNRVGVDSNNDWRVESANRLVTRKSQIANNQCPSLRMEINCFIAGESTLFFLYKAAMGR